MVKTQFDIQIKAVRSDNGGEFFNSQCADLFTNHGIIHQSSCPHTPQQNGVVERKHRHILETARAIRFQGHIPIRFWGECILTAVHIINRMPLSVLHNVSPFEVLFGKQPDIAYMRIMGCLCYATNTQKIDKFGARATKSVLMGYGTTQKGYKLYDLEHHIFFISRDVIFTENIFPFQSDSTDVLQSHSTDVLHDTNLEFMEDSQAEISMNANAVEDNTAPLPAVETASTYNVPGEEGNHIDNHVVMTQRRSSRSSKAPLWQQDFVLTKSEKSKHQSNCLYSISDNIDYSGLSRSYRCYIANSSMEKEPSTYHQAMKDERWVQAMKEEIKALEDNKTWELVELPIGKKAIGCK